MKKVLFGLVAIVMCMSAVMFTSCSKDAKLKAAAEKANKECPKEQDGVTIAKIEYDEKSHTLTYNYELPAEQYPMFQAMYAANSKQFTDFFLYSNKDDKDIKDLATLLVEVKGTLKFVLKQKDGSDKIELSFDADTLKKLVDGKLEKVDAPQLPQQEAAPAEAGAEEQAAPAEETTGEEEATGEEATGEEGGEEGGEYAE